MRWPPIIDAGPAPAWAVARDVAATLAAWALMLHFIHDLLWMAGYWIAFALGFDLPPAWAPGEMWRDTVPFLKIVALMVIWLVGFTLLRWHLITSRGWIDRQPGALPASEHAQAFDISIDALLQLRRARTATLPPVNRRREGISK